MKFRNPWIDPRVARVRPAQAQAYLLRRGWTPLPTDGANLVPFEAPSGADRPVVQVPLLEQARDYPQRVIELITDLALLEDRYAVAVLDDILHAAPPVAPADAPGTPVPGPHA